MPGEIWRSAFEVGRETVYGTAVASTRKMYFTTDGSALADDYAPEVHHIATGSRDNVRAITNGGQVPGGQVVQPLSADESLELFLMSVQGGVTPTTPGGTTPRLWTLTPGNSAPDSATWRWLDGDESHRESGVYVGQWTIDGSANGANTITADLFGAAMVQEALTGGLPERTPTFLQGWETTLAIDEIGGIAGTTVIPCTMINWTITFNNQMERQYCAANTQAAQVVNLGELDITARMMIRTASTQAPIELAALRASTPRLVQVAFGQNSVIEPTFTSFVKINLPLKWTAVNLGGTDAGARTWDLTGTYLYSATAGYGIQVQVQNARAAAWAA